MEIENISIFFHVIRLVHDRIVSSSTISRKLLIAKINTFRKKFEKLKLFRTLREILDETFPTLRNFLGLVKFFKNFEIFFKYLELV